ncbi:MAG: hypothetical protein Q9163_001941 [Psora crenata]
MALTLTDSQLNALQVTERVTSILSMLGIIFILSTFLLVRGFDKPINRLIFFASWSNLGMNIASMIAEDGQVAGQNSSLCQFQAWAIQMWVPPPPPPHPRTNVRQSILRDNVLNDAYRFLGVDVLWALCMAFNVYLALFQQWTARRMRAQEWKYFAGCYGVSFVPALVYLFVDTEGRGKVYGHALLWCWITPEWDFLRIVTLYGIVWFALFFAFCIYCLAFIKVWRNRHDLSGFFNPFNEDPFAGTITTDIEIVRTSVHPSPPSSESANYRSNPLAGLPQMPGMEHDATSNAFDPYSVNVEVGIQDEESGRRPSRPEMFRVRSLTRNHALAETNPDAWLYARVAFLFFCALLISWVPSSINRLYSLAHPDDLQYGLNYTEALVLPLQGFWNACVYIITSQTAVRNLLRSIIGKPELSRKNVYAGGNGLEAANGDKRRDLTRGTSKGFGRLTPGRNKIGKGEAKKHERLGSLGTERIRLGSDTSSVTSLTVAHHQ